MKTPFRIRTETEDDKGEYYNKEAAHERQRKLEADKAALFASGGKVKEVKR